jgi:hypothetical protein
VISAPISGTFTAMSHDRTRTDLLSWAQRQAETYRNGHDRPLAGYLTLMSVYAASAASTGVTARCTGRAAPRLSPWDVFQLSVATHKVSRLLAKDPVTSPLRAPFTTYTGQSAPAELDEEVRGHGIQQSIGELLTCPMCLAQWVATCFSIGLVFAPGPARMALSTFTAVAGSDFLQHLYVKLQQATE